MEKEEKSGGRALVCVVLGKFPWARWLRGRREGWGDGVLLRDGGREEPAAVLRKEGELFGVTAGRQRGMQVSRGLETHAARATAKAGSLMAA